MATRRPIIAGNWKMYKTTADARAMATELAAALAPMDRGSLPEVVLCAPFTALTTVRDTLAGSPIEVAAQTMDAHEEGAYTGEIAPAMLTDLGLRWVVLGHSERRQYFNETDETVQAKVQAARRHGLTPIICVGETLAEREAGQTDAVIRRQTVKALEGLPADALSTVVIAYEPVWAIGTGRVCDADEANRVCGLIRALAAEQGPADGLRVLYGGSVKPDNSVELLAQPEIDGALVGGASLTVAQFLPIIQAALVPAAAAR